VCGIAGMVTRLVGSRPGCELLRAMCSVIEHRGPDDEGYYSAGSVALGMRRLSIIDVDGGQQPVRNENGTVWAVFNGEIYNFRQLRADLEAHGHAFTTNSDSETIVHAYETYGDDFVARLHGMFAIALWDVQRRRLILARDRFGKKPLFYAELSSGLVFGSELKCLLLHPDFDRTIDPLALDEFLAYGYVPAPRTIFARARKVKPAHMLTLADGRLTERRYWHLEPRTQTRKLTPRAWQSAADQLESVIEDAVRNRLISDVPLGAFLSGGLDSSVVVAMMARLTREPVKTFTIGLDDALSNEAPAAARTAATLGTDHHQLIVRPDFQCLLPRIVWGMDEPLADPSVIPTYYVSRLARKHVTVALSGDGGDEAFAGYTRYALTDRELAFDHIPRSVRSLAAAIGEVLPRGVRGKNLLRRLPQHWTRRYALGLTIFPRAERYALYPRDFTAQLQAHDQNGYLEGLFTTTAHADVISALQWVDVHSYLANDILVKVDRMSMINSLETRAPLLDHNVMQLAFELPSEAFYRAGVGKLLFREVARRLVPPELLARPKSGFGIPVSRWLRGELRPLVHAILLDRALLNRAWFDPGYVRHLVKDHESGLFDNGLQIWTLLILEMWAQQYLDQDLHARAHLASTGLATQYTIKR
jgi:asparagine synthase (glutamine-hydrolysing)